MKPDTTGTTANFLKSFESPDAKRKAKHDDEEVGVLRRNWKTVMVYRTCQWIVREGFGGRTYQGISAQELHAAFELHCTPRSRRQLIAARIQHVMVPAARNVLNKAS